jgi:hypothetical protein
MGAVYQATNRFFLKILLKRGTYAGMVAGQDMRQNLFAVAQTQGGDSHRPGRGSRNFHEEPPSHHSRNHAYAHPVWCFFSQNANCKARCDFSTPS